MEEKELLGLCALNRIFCYDPVRCLKLLEYFGTAAAVIEAPPTLLEKLLSDAPRYLPLISREAFADAARELAGLERIGACFVGMDGPGYPPLLKECPDRPVGLYIRSDTPPEDLFARRSVAFVGTRDLSPYGREWCGNLVTALAESGDKMLIVSGLAFGIDCVAHTTALSRGLPTIGVMATGIESVYPTRHARLAEQMVHAPGSGLVSCYPPGTSPTANQFLSRNRIIAGMTEATVLVESKIKGGGLVTARHAFSYDRDVYALPGRVDDVRSRGCNFLLRNKTAEPVIGREDLLEKLGLKATRLTESDLLARAEKTYGPDSAEMRLLAAVAAERGVDVHTLCQRLSLPYAEVIATVTALESEGFLTMDILQRCSVL